MGQHQRERGNAEDREPDHPLAADAVSDRAAEDGADRHREQEGEQIQLGRALRHAKALHQIERVIGAQRRHIEVLREQQHHQHRHGARHGTGRQARRACHRLARRAGMLGQPLAIPAADAPQHRDRQQGRQRQPGDAALRVHHHGRQQWPRRASHIAADLEDRLRQPVAPARSHPSHARRFRMEDRGAGADQRRGDQQYAIAGRDRQQQQSRQRETHADRQRMRLRMLVGVQADQRLQQRGGDLIGQRQQPDLHEAQIEAALEHWVDRQDQRLDHVVEHVGEADRGQHAEAGALAGGGGAVRGRCGRPGRCHGGIGHIAQFGRQGIDSRSHGKVSVWTFSGSVRAQSGRRGSNTAAWPHAREQG